MLTDRQKQVAWDALMAGPAPFINQFYAAVEAALAEQARAAEQGQDEYSLAQPSPLRYVPSFTTGGTVPTQPPAGDAQMVRDVVDNMRCAYDKHAPKGEEARHPGMAAALAIAREGYVSLEDALGPICEERVNEIWESRKTLRDGNLCDYGAIAPVINAELTYRRNRLAKPAERVADEQKVEAILTKWAGHDGHKLVAAEIVAALKAGKQCS